MIYRHKGTGAVIDVESTMGGAWEPVKAHAPARAAKDEPKPEETKKPARKKPAKG